MSNPYRQIFIFLLFIIFLFPSVIYGIEQPPPPSTVTYSPELQRRSKFNLHDFLAKFETDDLLHFGYGGFLGGWGYKKTNSKGTALSSVVVVSVIKEAIDKHETGRWENTDIVITTFGACLAIYF